MKINVGDRVKLLGGYHMEPKWLHGGDGYPVIIIDFLENSAALIEFEEEIEFDGFTGKYGLLELRYAD
jgi:hypothetical protein